jgi:hypothetical protein
MRLSRWRGGFVRVVGGLFDAIFHILTSLTSFTNDESYDSYEVAGDGMRMDIVGIRRYEIGLLGDRS